MRTLIQGLASNLTLNEGGKSSAKVADVRQLVADLSDMLWSEVKNGMDPKKSVYVALLNNGRRRDKKKRKK